MEYPGVFAGNRILVLGCPGSGKSTFACKLHRLTGIPLIHLDNIWWNADRTHCSREAFDRRLEEVMREDRWILDGDYSRTYEPRIRACDVIVFLDYMEEECMRGITERVGKTREDIPWTEQTLDPELVAMVKSYRTKNRPVLQKLLEQYSEKQQLVFENREQAEEWLFTL